MSDSDHRESCLRATGALLGALARAGAHHPDLNARNVLITWDAAAGASAHILDVDRIRFYVPSDPMVRSANMERLERSLRKLRSQHELSITEAEIAAIAAAGIVPAA